MRHFTDTISRVPQNFSKEWLLLLDTQTRAQMEWVLRRKWHPRNTYPKKQLRINGCDYTPQGRILRGEARRVSLVSLHRRLCSFRDILARNTKRRYTKRECWRETKIMVKPEFINTETFVEILQTIMVEKNISHMEGIIELCNKYNIEIESVAELITPQIRKLIQNEAITLNMMKKRKQRRLPL